MGKLTGKKLYFSTLSNFIVTPQKPTSQTYFEQTLKPILFYCYLLFQCFPVFCTKYSVNYYCATVARSIWLKKVFCKPFQFLQNLLSVRFIECRATKYLNIKSLISRWRIKLLKS